MIIIMSPAAENTARVSQIFEHVFVQTFVYELAIAPKDREAEPLNEAVLHGFIEGDRMPGYPAFILPFQDRRNGQFASTVTDDRVGRTAKSDQAIQFPSDPLTRQERVGDEVEAPAFAGPIRDRHRALVPVARLRPRRRYTASPSSRYSRRSQSDLCGHTVATVPHIWFMTIPSRTSVSSIRR